MYFSKLYHLKRTPSAANTAVNSFVIRVPTLSTLLRTPENDHTPAITAINGFQEQAIWENIFWPFTQIIKQMLKSKDINGLYILPSWSFFCHYVFSYVACPLTTSNTIMSCNAIEKASLAELETLIRHSYCAIVNFVIKPRNILASKAFLKMCLCNRIWFSKFILMGV